VPLALIIALSGAFLISYFAFAVNKLTEQFVVALMETFSNSVVDSFSS